MANYVLRERIQNALGTVKISEEEFEEIERARLINQETLAIEEKYYILLQNYFDLERTIHDLALSNLLFRAQRWGEHVDNIHSVNRELLNLLSAGKAYLDQVPQHLNAIFKPSRNESESFEKETNNEFDAVLGYRVMSAVRNHAQHGDFPIQSLALGGKWTQGEGKRLCRNAATGFIHLDGLLQNEKVNSNVRAELQGLGEKLDLKPLVRQYMSSLARLHKHARTAIEAAAKHNEQIIRAAHERYEAEVGQKPVALAALAIGDSGVTTKSHFMFLDGIERRTYLLRRCSTVLNLEFHCITSEIQ